MIQLFSWEIANALKKEYVVIFNWGLEMRPRGFLGSLKEEVSDFRHGLL